MKKLLFILFCISFCAAPIFAQKLTKEELVEKSNALLESKKQRDALEILDQYPEFSDETDVLYVRSISYTELRDYKNADIAYQKGFDIFLKNAAESLAIAEEYAAKTPATKLDKEMTAMMYSTAMISFASAELTNALRSVAFGKNGMPEAKREPKNLAGFEDFKRKYAETAIKSGESNFKNNLLKEAVSDFDKAIELDPKNAAAYSGRAKIYRKQRKLKLAMSDEANARKYTVKK